MTEKADFLTKQLLKPTSIIPDTSKQPIRFKRPQKGSVNYDKNKFHNSPISYQESKHDFFGQRNNSVHKTRNKNKTSLLRTVDIDKNHSTNQSYQNTEETGIAHQNTLPPIVQQRPNFAVSPDMSTGYQFGTSMNVSPTISPSPDGELNINDTTFQVDKFYQLTNDNPGHHSSPSKSVKPKIKIKKKQRDPL